MDEINESLVVIMAALMQIDSKLDKVVALLEDDGEEEED